HSRQSGCCAPPRVPAPLQDKLQRPAGSREYPKRKPVARVPPTLLWLEACQTAWLEGYQTGCASSGRVATLRFGCGVLLIVLGRHSRRKQRRKRHSITCLRCGFEFSRRGIAARRVDDDLRKNVFPHGLDHTALAVAEVGGATTLSMPSSHLALGLVGSLRQDITVGKTICPGDTAGPIVLVEFFDPEINRSGITFHRVRVHDPRLQQLEAGRQPLGRRPAKQSTRAA